MRLKSRIERIETGIDVAALSPEQIARLDVSKLTREQVRSLNLSRLTDAQIIRLNVEWLLDEQLEAALSTLPPNERAWLSSLTDEELRAFGKGEMVWPQF